MKPKNEQTGEYVWQTVIVLKGVKLVVQKHGY